MRDVSTTAVRSRMSDRTGGRRWAPTAPISGLRGWTQAELGGLEVDESTGLAIAAPPPWPLLLVLELQQPDVVVEREALGRAPQDRADLAQGQAQSPPCVPQAPHEADRLYRGGGGRCRRRRREIIDVRIT